MTTFEKIKRKELQLRRNIFLTCLKLKTLNNKIWKKYEKITKKNKEKGKEKQFRN